MAATEDQGFPGGTADDVAPEEMTDAQLAARATVFTAEQTAVLLADLNALTDDWDRTAEPVLHRAAGEVRAAMIWAAISGMPHRNTPTVQPRPDGVSGDA